MVHALGHRPKKLKKIVDFFKKPIHVGVAILFVCALIVGIKEYLEANFTQIFVLWTVVACMMFVSAKIDLETADSANAGVSTEGEDKKSYKIWDLIISSLAAFCFPLIIYKIGCVCTTEGSLSYEMFQLLGQYAKIFVLSWYPVELTVLELTLNKKPHTAACFAVGLLSSLVVGSQILDLAHVERILLGLINGFALAIICSISWFENNVLEENKVSDNHEKQESDNVSSKE